MKFTSSHAAMLACSLGAAVAEVLAQYVSAGNPLPFHLAAGAALTGLTALGAVSKSILAEPPSAAPSMVASDVLRAVATSLDRGGATAMHMAILDAVKQNVLTAPSASEPSK